MLGLQFCFLLAELLCHGLRSRLGSSLELCFFLGQLCLHRCCTLAKHCVCFRNGSKGELRFHGFNLELLLLEPVLLKNRCNVSFFWLLQRDAAQLQHCLRLPDFLKHVMPSKIFSRYRHLVQRNLDFGNVASGTFAQDRQVDVLVPPAARRWFGVPVLVQQQGSLRFSGINGIANLFRRVGRLCQQHCAYDIACIRRIREVRAFRISQVHLQ